MTELNAKISYESLHTRLIACDSDGCAFDVMDIKHKECFCPAFIKHFGLQNCAKQAREVWEFVNLYSVTRGSNRFLAVGMALELLSEHPAVRAAEVSFMDFSQLYRFLKEAEALGEPSLQRAAALTDDAALKAMLAWTREVNILVKEMCHGVASFAGVGTALQRAAETCDVVVVSQAPRSTLVYEWAQAGLDSHAVFIAGQEFGTKAAQVKQILESVDTNYEVLVLGDALGDQFAAEAAGARFFPIIPGDEVASWRRFVEEGLPRFNEGRFDDSYQASLLHAFSHALPKDPPWLA
ncbi:hypothetical protein QEH52_13130 [Coraliomargarita sp. SDUM461003]|uniref:Haloacid dehalogenase n=1 Tax=Thalassobacterium maritimum TaxID=3041265 RepID=A0ABU1AZ93_9BACT|nr:hypothetical protein [Coraliomargarita sp. SDUM461003]MDQ8208460.1 hypothetical protein [Coraliomargarita sp. SDUM461003]